MMLLLLITNVENVDMLNVQLLILGAITFIFGILHVSVFCFLFMQYLSLSNSIPFSSIIIIPFNLILLSYIIQIFVQVHLFLYIYIIF